MWGCQDSNPEPCVSHRAQVACVVVWVASLSVTVPLGEKEGSPRASGVGSAGVAGLGAFRGPMVFPTLESLSPGPFWPNSWGYSALQGTWPD